MCIALPRRVLAVVDGDRLLVAVEAPEAGPETVSAALVVTSDQSVGALVGAFVLVHAGFVLSLVDEAEAQSRLQVFAAMRGEGDAFDLSEFYADTAGTAPPSGRSGS